MHVLRALSIAVGVAVLSAAVDSATAQERKLVAVCSTTQVADFTRQVVGDRWEVFCILGPGQDPHLYQVKPDDVKLAARADLCLENGWHLEGKDWMRELAQGQNKPLVTCVEGVAPLELEEGGTPFRDPHAWFTPQNAAVYVRNILKAVCERDPEHAEEYRARATLYLNQLQTLHAWIQQQVNALPASQRVLVTSHDAFNYFCRQYGFQSASPAGWSTGDEIGGGITPERRRQTVESIRKFGAKAIFVETSVHPKVVREIAREAGVEVGGELYSDSMGAPGTAGETYQGMMRENVLTIVFALK
jgi:manganese/iron transport system substrate-binding protein